MGGIDNTNEQGEGLTKSISEIFRKYFLSKNREDKTMKMPEHLRVLYAEDNEDSCFMVTVMLKFADIEVTTARTVAESWQMAQADYFDLYLLDSRFPDGNGFSLCRRLREYAPHTPILFYSGSAYEADKQNGLAAGANDYLTKPYFDDLAETIRQTIKETIKPTRETETIIVEAQIRMAQHAAA